MIEYLSERKRHTLSLLPGIQAKHGQSQNQNSHQTQSGSRISWIKKEHFTVLII
jgi:hypothetical protein